MITFNQWLKSMIGRRQSWWPLNNAINRANPLE